MDPLSLCRYCFDSLDALRSVCGINDKNIPYLQKLLGVELNVRGTEILFENEPSGAAVKALLSRLALVSDALHELSEAEIFLEYRAIALDSEHRQKEAGLIVMGKPIVAKTRNQRAYLKALKECQVTFAIGPAGTGKTFLAMAYCLSMILSGQKQKLVLTRPVVEAGESLGFLPGDLSAKLNPYLRPLYDAMDYLAPNAAARRLEESGVIEIAPLAYMRGRSINNACILLDEAQNTTGEQMKMLLTRLGENSIAVITGDVTQIDLPKGRLSGLVDASQRLRHIDGIGFVDFDNNDVVRSRLVRRIVEAYEKESQG